MTKIPVDYAYEEIWKVSESKEDKKMKRKMKRKKWNKEEMPEVIHLICELLVIGVAGLILLLIVGSAVDKADSRAQCESIGGRYGQKACWYNGEKVDVNKYVEEWK